MIPEIEQHPKLVEARRNLQAAKEGFERAEKAVLHNVQTREASERGAARAIAAGKKPKRLVDSPDPAVLAQAVNEHREAIQIAEQAERDALDEAKRDVLSNLQREHAAAVKVLRTKLQAAAGANAEVRAIEGRAQLLRGLNGSPGLPRLSWPELGEESPTRANKLSTWLRQVEAYLPKFTVAPRKRKRLPKTASA